ncbi:hypothetical protein Adu01nite_86360 [Paractinoplanes durhamensis]|uniref:Uncharacterized protein n=1 Tax=Paractinoplanes durhamensis TaxID=113563 RepID=A0ABQ3ZBT3_9ACTN|nr:hypothetical protein Adu01nite_86360 [Actinoplanes durhamensis]
MAPQFEKMEARPSSYEVGAERLEDHRQELRLMARRNGLDEEELRGLRDVTPAWSTKTGAPLGGASAVVPPDRPATTGSLTVSTRTTADGRTAVVMPATGRSVRR